MAGGADLDPPLLWPSRRRSAGEVPAEDVGVAEGGRAVDAWFGQTARSCRCHLSPHAARLARRPSSLWGRIALRLGLLSPGEQQGAADHVGSGPAAAARWRAGPVDKDRDGPTLDLADLIGHPPGCGRSASSPFSPRRGRLNGACVYVRVFARFERRPLACCGICVRGSGSCTRRSPPRPTPTRTLAAIPPWFAVSGAGG